jgi:hypothetical protein
VLERVFDQFRVESTPRTSIISYVIRFDGPRRQPEGCGVLHHPLSFQDQAQDVALPRGQQA